MRHYVDAGHVVVTGHCLGHLQDAVATGVDQHDANAFGNSRNECAQFTKAGIQERNLAPEW